MLICPKWKIRNLKLAKKTKALQKNFIENNHYYKNL